MKSVHNGFLTWIGNQLEHSHDPQDLYFHLGICVRGAS